MKKWKSLAPEDPLKDIETGEKKFRVIQKKKDEKEDIFVGLMPAKPPKGKHFLILYQLYYTIILV